MGNLSNFFHCHLCSEYSYKNSIIRLDDLLKKSIEYEMSNLAITDQMNLHGAIKLSKLAWQANIKPIIGAEIEFSSLPPPLSSKVIFLCQDLNGYKNLARLIFSTFLKNDLSPLPIADFSKVTKESFLGLLGIFGISQCSTWNAPSLELKKLLEIFKNRFYLRLERFSEAYNPELEKLALSFSSQVDAGIVATNRVFFLKEGDFKYQQIREAISLQCSLDDLGHQNREKTSREQYFKSPVEMEKQFSDLPEAIANVNQICFRCNFAFNLKSKYLPCFKLENQQHSNLEILKRDSYSNLLRILKERGVSGGVPDQYQKRLEEEISVLEKMEFVDYFLIVADFIKWAHDHNIPVGPGRGSGGGSLVAFALGITKIDPLVHDLLFERFLNIERFSLPDIDVDFCMLKRDLVIHYIRERYGSERVAQITTFSTMNAKGVLRDVGRVLGYTYNFIDRIAKLVPMGPEVSLEAALSESRALAKLYKNDSEIQNLFKSAFPLEGLIRNCGKHAGGVVIAPTELTNFTALYFDQENQMSVTHFDKDDLESIGLIKFDFLGLKTLTIIANAVTELEKDKKVTDLNIDALPLNDNEVFSFLAKAQTTAVFQLESHGIKELIKRYQPDSFADIVALIALYRPGPLQSGMVEDFVNRRHGKTETEYYHPDLERILKSTYGIIIYQEQVMQIAQVLANYSLGEADTLRSAMGKKKYSVMLQQREIFLKRAIERGIEEKLANSIFDLMEHFSGYGFNKAHATGYAFLTYQCLWLKTHFSAYFLASAMSADFENTNKIGILVNEVKQMGLKIFPPDINKSGALFKVKGDSGILYGLAAVKGVGLNAAKNIVNERKNGPYKGLLDFCIRTRSYKIGKRLIEFLIKAGAFSEIDKDRRGLLDHLKQTLTDADKEAHLKATGQLCIQHLVEDSSLRSIENLDCGQIDSTLIGEYELESLGLYLTVHPLDKYQELIQSLPGIIKIKNLPQETEKTLLVFAIITSIRVIKTKSDKKMAFIKIDDGSQNLDCSVSPSLFQKFEEDLKIGAILLIALRITRKPESEKSDLNIIGVCSSDEIFLKFAEEVIFGISRSIKEDSFTIFIDKITKNTGKCQVEIKFHSGDKRVILRLDKNHKIELTNESFLFLKNLVEVEVCWNLSSLLES